MHQQIELTDPGEFVAARKHIVGREKVALFIRKVTRLAESHGKLARTCIVDVNGMPALLVELEPARTDWAPRQVFMMDVDEHGRAERMYVVLASRKLGRVDFSGLRSVHRVQATIVRAARALFTWLQRPEQRLSKHIQVHPGSRVRPRANASDG